MNILGILVIYDQERACPAVEKFRKVIDKCSKNYTIVTVNNNKNLDVLFEGNIIKGTNSSAEFSGWDEALNIFDFAEFDVVIYANDTFFTRARFEEGASYSLKSTLLQQRTKKYIIGEVCWSINYSNLIRGRKYLLRWVRTSIFAISKDAMSMIGTVGIDSNDCRYHLAIDADRKISYGNRIPDLVKWRINNWIFPAEQSSGWHSAQKVNNHVLEMKAKSVLQELMLTKNCDLKKIKVIDYRSLVSFRYFVFKTLYAIQKFFPE